MGIGDEIMAVGNARKAFAADPSRRVMVVDLRGVPRWSALWENIGWMATADEVQTATRALRANIPLARSTAFQLLRDGPRCRPYIDYKKGFTRATGINFKDDYAARDQPGFIELSPMEERTGEQLAAQIGRFVLVEPYVKPDANPNKQWGRAKWQSLADLLNREGFNVVQFAGTNMTTPRLDGVSAAVTQSFRHGVALMKRAHWSFLPDGGLHHACGALDLPATVLWGGANDPAVLGYAGHENIFTPPMCGKWLPCQHCKAIWAALTAEEVFERTKGNPRWK